MISSRLIALGVLGALCVLGCGKSGPSRQPLRGSITIDGVSLEQGAISLRPAAGSSAPAAVTTVENGAYRFTSKNGPMPGSYSVKINVDPESEQGKAILKSAAARPTAASGTEAVGPKGGSLALPPRPTNRRDSRANLQPKLHWELQYTVPEEGSATKDFELSN